MLIQKKDASVETLRSLALILLVAFHSIESYYPGGYDYFSYSFLYFRMPLFTVISGFVYAIRPVTPGVEIKFLKGKIRRILLPLVCVSTLYFLLRSVVSDNDGMRLLDIWQIYLYRYEYFWFLQSIFLIFLTFLVLDRFGWVSRIETWFVWLLITVAMTFSLPQWEFLSLDGYLYLLPYFTLGYGLNRYADKLLAAPIVVTSLVALVIGVILHQLNWYGYLTVIHEKISPLGLLVGLTGTLLLFRFRIPIPGLAQLGGYSYTVYLFHGFGIAIAYKASHWLGFSEYYFWEFIVKILCGLTGGVVAELVFQRYFWTRRLLLGLR